MHPQDFKSILNHIYDVYSTLNDELSRLRKENKALNEELVKTRSINKSLTAQLSDISNPKIQKMGADWHIEGETLFGISLSDKMKLNGPICNCRISPEGKMAFTCSGMTFLSVDGTIFLVKDTIEEYDVKNLKKDLVDDERRPFDFAGEDLVAYYKGKVSKFGGNETEWFLTLSGVQAIRVDGDLVYIGVKGGFVHVYNTGGDFIKTIKLGREIDSFEVKDGCMAAILDRNFLLYTDDRDMTVQKYDSRIMGVDLDREKIYTIHENGELRMIKRENKRFETVDKVVFKSPGLSVRRFKGFLVVGTEDRRVRIVNLESKKEMEVVLPYNVIEIDENGEKVCFVDNDGGMRTWEIDH